MKRKKATGRKSKGPIRKRPTTTTRPILGSIPIYSFPENKYFDSTKAATALVASADWTGTEFDPATLNTLFVPQEGSGISGRIGRKVFVKTLRIRGLFNFVKVTAQTSVPVFPQIRLILFMDMATNIAQAQGEQVMATPGTSAVDNAICSHMSLANLGRFRILKDKTYTRVGMESATDAGTGTISADCSTIPFKFNINFKTPVEVHFNATNGGTIADIVDNSFHILVNSNTTQYQINYECRTVYTDT